MNNDGMKRFIENIRRQQEDLNRLAQLFAQNMPKITLNIPHMIAQFEQVRAILEPVRGIIRRLPEDYSKAQKYLFEEGWYLGSDMPLPDYKNLAEMVEADKLAEIEDAMCEWARTRVEAIIKSAASAFPARAQVLEDAAEAHLGGKYTLSIPVFFAQSDGMANDIIGNCLFRGNPTKAIKNKLAQFGDFPMSDLSDILLDPLRGDSDSTGKGCDEVDLSDILLDPLRERSIFYTCSTKQATKSGVKLANRSEVMHGAQLDYASEANSLRCIVLLGYLVGVKSLLESHEEHDNELRRMALEFGVGIKNDGGVTC